MSANKISKNFIKSRFQRLYGFLKFLELPVLWLLYPHCTLFRIRFGCVVRAPFVEIKGADLQETVLNTSFFYATNLRCTCFCSGFSASQLRYLYIENLTFRYRKVSIDQKLLLQIPLYWEMRYLEKQFLLYRWHFLISSIKISENRHLKL